MDTLTVLMMVNGVLAGIPEAMLVYQQVKTMLDGGVDPTEQQLLDLKKSMDAVNAVLNPPVSP